MRPLLLFLATLLSGGALFFDRVIIFLFFLFLFLAYSKLRVKNANYTIKLTLFIGFIIIASFAIHGANAVLIFSKLSLILAALILLQIYHGDNFKSFQSDIVFLGIIFGIQAILTWLLANTVPGIFSIYNFGDTTIHSVYGILNYHEIIEGAIKRPDGFFWEPGVLQFYLNLSLFYSILLRKNITIIGLLIFSIIITGSTAGIMILCLIFLFYFKSIFRSLSSKTIFLGGFLIFITMMILPFIIGNIESKFTGDSSGSWFARQHDLVMGLRLIIDHPLFGIGVDPERYLLMTGNDYFSIFGLSMGSFEDRMPTNGALQIFYGFGIPIGLLYFYRIFNSRYVNKSLTHFSIIFITLMVELLALTPIFLFFAFSSFKSINKF